MSTSIDSDTNVLEKQKTALRPEKPPKFKVLLLNDDYTPFEFVIEILMEHFNKTVEQAVELAGKIHEEGKGVCGVFIKDIAELKQTKVMQAAFRENHPLQCVLAPDTPSPTNSRSMKP